MTCQFLNIKPLNYNVIVTKMSYSDDFNNCFLQSKKKKKKTASYLLLFFQQSESFFSFLFSELRMKYL